MAEVNGNRTDQQNTISANELQQTESPSGAESGAVAAEFAILAPDLAEVVARWQSLPRAVRDKVLVLVRGAHVSETMLTDAAVVVDRQTKRVVKALAYRWPELGESRLPVAMIVDLINGEVKTATVEEAAVA